MIWWTVGGAVAVIGVALWLLKTWGEEAQRIHMEVHRHKTLFWETMDDDKGDS